MKIIRRMEWPEPRNLTTLEGFSEYATLLYQTLTEESALRAVELEVPFTDGYNVFLGHEAGASDTISLDDTEGIYNVFIGHQAGYSNTTGIKNIAVGYKSLYTNTTGYENIALGSEALYSNTTGYYNVAMGHEAMKNCTTGDQNVGFGYKALTASTEGGANVAVGAYALDALTKSRGNTGVGVGSLTSFNKGTTDITYNTGCGANTLLSTTTGIQNTALGGYAGGSNQTGSASVFLGYEAGKNETASNKLYIANSNTATPLIYGDFSAGFLAINDNANAKMTAGLTINQGAADDEIFALKSNDVAHGCTIYAETDTFALFRKFGADAGGLLVNTFGESTYAVYFSGIYTTDNTSKDSNALAPVMCDAYKINGTDIAVQGADANTFVIRSGGSARFIVDEDGDILYDGTAGAYQDHDDIVLLGELEDVLSGKIDKDKIKDKDINKKHKIVHESKFVSTKKKNMLLYGAIRQLAARVKALEAGA